MPKRVGFLCQKLLDKKYIEKCINLGSKRKHNKRHDVRIVINNKEKYTDKTYKMMSTYDYIPTPPKKKTIYDKSSRKYRDLDIQPFFPDGVINQLLVEDILRPIIQKRLHHYCCASIRGRGGKCMLDYNKKAVQKHPRTSKYAAELDVKQFYPSVPLILVIKMLRRIIKDEKFLQLIAVTISFYPKGWKYSVENKISPEEIVGDKIGLSIGLHINQWLANFVLSPLDYLLLNCDGVRYESRHMDNIVIISNNKRKLHRAIKAASEWLEERGMRIKEDWQLYPINSRAIDTVGYKVGRTCTKMRGKNFLNLTRQSRLIQKKMRRGEYISLHLAQSFLSRVGMLNHCSSKNIIDTYVLPIRVKFLKNIVRAHARKGEA